MWKRACAASGPRLKAVSRASRFDFGTALGLLIRGQAVRRVIWRGQWLEPEGPTPYAVLCRLDGSREPWCMGIDDMRATDWLEINPESRD